MCAVSRRLDRDVFVVPISFVEKAILIDIIRSLIICEIFLEYSIKRTPAVLSEIAEAFSTMLVVSYIDSIFISLAHSEVMDRFLRQTIRHYRSSMILSFLNSNILYLHLGCVPV